MKYTQPCLTKCENPMLYNSPNVTNLKEKNKYATSNDRNLIEPASNPVLFPYSSKNLNAYIQNSLQFASQKSKFRERP